LPNAATWSYREAYFRAVANRTNFRFVPLRRGNAPIASRWDDRDLNPTFLRIEVRVRVSFISRLLRACLAQPEDHHQCNRHVCHRVSQDGRLWTSWPPGIGFLYLSPGEHANRGAHSTRAALAVSLRGRTGLKRGCHFAAPWVHVICRVMGPEEPCHMPSSIVSDGSHVSRILREFWRSPAALLGARRRHVEPTSTTQTPNSPRSVRTLCGISQHHRKRSFGRRFAVGNSECSSSGR
jgi:hypothetical protein